MSKKAPKSKAPKVAKAQSKPTIPVSLDTADFRQTWTEWCDFTRQRGAELSDEDQVRQLKLLAKQSPEAAIGDVRKTMATHPLKDNRPETAQESGGKKNAKAKAAKAKPDRNKKKMGALDAAAKVLVEKGEPMNCKEMIDAMSAKGYWKSPGGLTPAATLYSAILRELKIKGKEARFAKTERGKFASTAK